MFKDRGRSLNGALGVVEGVVKTLKVLIIRRIVFAVTGTKQTQGSPNKILIALDNF